MKKKFFFSTGFPCFLINRSNHEQLFATSNQSVKRTNGKDLLKSRVSKIIRDQTWNKVKKGKIYKLQRNDMLFFCIYRMNKIILENIIIDISMSS